MSTQTFANGRHAPALHEAMTWLASQRYLQRLEQGDASLWSADPAVQSTIRRRLGWLTIARTMAARTESLHQFAEEIRREGMTHAVLLGMGGSGLFTEVCRHTMPAAPPPLDVTVLDTTDPTAIQRQRQRCPLERLLVIISSKSGSTSEISALSKYFYHAFASAGVDAGAHAVVITDVGTPLEAQTTAWKCRRLFTHGPGTGAEVGGRFSALTYFGLVPAALMGAQTATLLSRADAMRQRCGPQTPLEENPAVQLGAALGTFAKIGIDKLTLLCPPSLASVGTWIEQLIAESTGKMGRGIAPVHGEPWQEGIAYGTDRLFVELQFANQPDSLLDEHVRGLIAAGHPVIRIQWQDPYDLGGEVMKWFIATAIAGSLLSVNPFDEPNVQESKDRTKALLDHYAREGRLPDDETALFADEEVALYGAVRSHPPESLTHAFAAFLEQLRPQEYVALLSFLPRTPSLDDAVQAWRAGLAKRLAHATMLGFGPRYLHSTGQLYKGGPDAGIFLLVTAESRGDVPIPGEPWTFGILKEAQALGDVQALQQRGRRILHIHLRGDLERALQRVQQNFDEAVAQFAPR